MRSRFPKLVLVAIVLVGSIPAASSARQDEDQIKLGADLVEVRAVVTDKNGRPVLGLTKDDFEVLDSGRPQEPTFFSVDHVPAPRRDSAATATAVAGHDEPMLPPIRTVVLFVDDLHLAPLSLGNVEAALKKFVASDLSDRDLLGLVTASGRVRMFGQFGADRTALNAAIEALPLGPRDAWPARFSPFIASLIEQNPSDENPALAYAITVLMESEGGGASGPAGAAAAQADIQRVRQTAREVLQTTVVRRRATLDSIKLLCDQLAGLPGQRLVIAFTDGFSIRDNNGVPNGDELRVVGSHAARAGVVVNTVIAKGLTVDGGFSAELGGAPSPQFAGQRMYFERASSRDDENGGAGLAKATGGELFADNNDLAGRARAVLEHNDSYYAFAYYMPDESSGGEFRKVEVRVKGHPEYSVRSQGGYLPAEGPSNAKAAPAAATRKLTESVFGLDVPRQLTVTIDVAKIEPSKAGSRVTLSAHVQGEGIELPTDGSRHEVALDVATVVFDPAGKLVFASSVHVGGSLSPDDAKDAATSGLRYASTTDPLKPGIYQARIAFQDTKTGRLGARAIWIHVPKAKR